MMTIECIGNNLQRWITCKLELHRLKYPAYFYTHNHRHTKAYYVLNVRHRNSNQGPQYTRTYPNGQLHIMYYTEHGACHRAPEQGPAITLWSPEGKILSKRYCVKGHQVHVDN